MLSGGTAEGTCSGNVECNHSQASQERDTGTQGYFIPELNSSDAIRGCSMQGYQALHPLQNTQKPEFRDG